MFLAVPLAGFAGGLASNVTADGGLYLLLRGVAGAVACSARRSVERRRAISVGSQVDMWAFPRRDVRHERGTRGEARPWSASAAGSISSGLFCGAIIGVASRLGLFDRSSANRNT